MASIYQFHRAGLEDGLRFEAEFYQPKYLLKNAKHANWQTIGTVLQFCQYGSSLPLNEEGDGYPIYRLNEISDCLLTEPQKWVRMTEDEYESLKLRPNDVLFCRTNGNFELVGRTGILKHNIDAVFASYLVRVRTNPRHLLPEFLTVYLNSHFGKLQIQRRAMRSNQVNVSASQLKAIPIPICSMPFQEKIAESVQTAADEISESNLFYRKAEQLLLSESGLQNWRPPHTLTYARNYSQAARARRMDAEHFQPKYQEMFGAISPNVRLDRLGKLTTYTKGVEVGSSAYADAGIPFWRVSNLTKHGLDDGNANFISDELYNSLRSSYEPQQGEMLLSKDATLGLAYYLEAPTKSIVSSGILRLSSIESIPPHYLELALNSLFVQLQIEQDAGGSIIKHWKPSEVRKTLIPRLSPAKETEIAALVQQSHAARREAKGMLERARRAVEIAIIEEEEKAMEYVG